MPDPMRSPLADYHLSHGATLGEYHGAVVPARYSDPKAEHEAVRKAAGIFDFSFRAKFAAKGSDHVTFLHNMLSNDVKGLTPGHGTYATLLNVKGHIVADLRIYCEKDRILVDTDSDLRDKTIQTLNRYIIMDDVELELLELFAVAVQGPSSRALLEKSLQIDLATLEEFDHLQTNCFGFPVHVVRASSTGEEGYELWAGAEGMAAAWKVLCGQALPCGTDALETLRIEAGIPRYGPDMGEDTLPLEAGLFSALSFTKGCYIGQEIVERARSRGHVNWKLVGLFVDGGALPSPGERLFSVDEKNSKELGEVTSAVFSPTLGRMLALAYVRREISEPGTKLALASGPAAEVTTLPFYRPEPGSRI